jgi:hypothetical protein
MTNREVTVTRDNGEVTTYASVDRVVTEFVQWKLEAEGQLYLVPTLGTREVKIGPGVKTETAGKQ